MTAGHTTEREAVVLDYEGLPAECNGICLSASDIGIPVSGIAYPHPECDLHSPGWWHKYDEDDRRSREDGGGSDGN